MPGIKYEDSIYECYGPHGVAILLETLTDNKNRTVSEIKNILTKNGGNLGEAGCVNWMFEKKGTISIPYSVMKEEEILELLDYDIEDLQIEDDYYIITTKPDNFGSISKILEEHKINIDGELGLVASNIIKVTESESRDILTLLDELDNHDDVQKVHTNFEVD